MKNPKAKIPRNGNSEKSECDDDNLEKGDIIMYEDSKDFEFYEIIGDYCEVETKYDYELENIKNNADAFVVSGETMKLMLQEKFKKVALDKENIIG
jgi:hypothetical protein